MYKAINNMKDKTIKTVTQNGTHVVPIPAAVHGQVNNGKQCPPRVTGCQYRECRSIAFLL